MKRCLIENDNGNSFINEQSHGMKHDSSQTNIVTLEIRTSVTICIIYILDEPISIAFILDCKFERKENSK